MYKKTLSLLGVALALSAFASQAESERQASREQIVEQVLKPCEGKKAGDKVVIIDRRGGEHEAICTLTAPLWTAQKSPIVPGHEPVVR